MIVVFIKYDLDYMDIANLSPLPYTAKLCYNEVTGT